MGNIVWPRDGRVLGASVTSGRLSNRGRRGVRVISPFHALPTGGVRPQTGTQIAAMADAMPDAQGKGLFGVRDWSPPA